MFKEILYKEQLETIGILKLFSNNFYLAGGTSIALQLLHRKIFGGGYNEKLLREKLCYFEDIDYSEEVEYIGNGYENEDIKKYLCNIAITE